MEQEMKAVFGEIQRLSRWWVFTQSVFLIGLLKLVYVRINVEFIKIEYNV